MRLVLVALALGAFGCGQEPPKQRVYVAEKEAKEVCETHTVTAIGACQEATWSQCTACAVTLENGAQSSRCAPEVGQSYQFCHWVYQ